MPDEGKALWYCRRCGTTRPKFDWPTRYGVIECGPCLVQGYVGLLERPDTTPKTDPKE